MIRRSTWIVVVVFLAVLLVALYMQRTGQQASADATPTAGVTFLFEDLGEDIRRMRISSASGEAVEVEGSPLGAWTLVEPAGQAADEARISSAVSQVQNLRVVSELENPPAAEEVGLNPPVYQIAITTAGGQEQTAEIGLETPIQSGYYARREGGPIMVVSKSAADILIGLLDSPPVIAPTAPTGSETPGTGTPDGTSEAESTPEP